MILGYWDIRGLVHAARLLPEYTDSNDVERKYTMGDAPDYDRSQWLSEKSKLGLDFPNLPYSIDAAHELTQSNAILRKHDLQRDRAREDSRGCRTRFWMSACTWPGPATALTVRN